MQLYEHEQPTPEPKMKMLLVMCQGCKKDQRIPVYMEAPIEEMAIMVGSWRCLACLGTPTKS